eukprot:m.50870 g.50870  ORF g.50870 m.50870 type:complete len:982 (-) comp12181_c0_seq2:62-3007(-)
MSTAGNNSMSEGEWVDELGGVLEAKRADVLRAMIAEAQQAGAAAPEQVALLLSQQLPNKGCTPLHLAITTAQPDAVRTLLAAGADPSVPDEEGNLPFSLASGSEQLRNAFVTELLRCLASQQAEQRLPQLLRGGLDANATDGATGGNRPLHWAASFSSPQVVQMLIDSGAELDVQNAQGATALHDAAARDDVEVVRILRQAGANPGLKNNAGQTAAQLSSSAPVLLALASDAHGVASSSDTDSKTTSQTSTPPSSRPVTNSIFGALESFVEAAAQSLEEEERQMTGADDVDGSEASSHDDSVIMHEPMPTPPSSNVEPDDRLALLWPQPQFLSQLASPPFTMPASGLTGILPSGPDGLPADIDHAWRSFETKAKAYVPICRALDGEVGNLFCVINPNVCPRAEGYRLHTGAESIQLVGGGVAGLRHALYTLLQLVRIYQQEEAGSSSGLCIPALRVHDYPELAARGFMLDVSRDKVPTLDTLYQLVDLLAELKYNQLHLYLEHTYAYKDHRVVWDGCDPYTEQDIVALDAYCHGHGISLVPNQNSFGHFHRFLKHDEYRHLAECPTGINFGSRPSGPRDAPFSLCPIDPRSVELVASLYKELVPSFTTSSLLHVGLDETVDLGRGRSAEACQERGLDNVYLEYLCGIRDVAARLGRTTMFWADVVQELEAQVGGVLCRLPPDVIACEWGYEDRHPFDQRCQQLEAAGCSFMVCPGTSSWNSITGRTANMIGNIRSAAFAGAKHNAVGLLLTDWGDNGHIQPLSVSYPGIVTAAGFAWNPTPQGTTGEGQNRVACWQGEWGEDELAALLDVHVFLRPRLSLGRVLCDLGNTYLHCATSQYNGTLLFQFLVFHGEDPGIWANASLPAVRQALRNIKTQSRVLAEMAASGSLTPDQTMVVDELRFCCDLSTFAGMFCQALQRHQKPLPQLPGVTRTDLANRLLPLIGRHKELWLGRNRAGGLPDSVAVLTATLNKLLAGIAATF